MKGQQKRANSSNGKFVFLSHAHLLSNVTYAITFAALDNELTVGQMTTRRQVQSHNAVMGAKQSGECLEVSGASTVRLHVHAPLLRVQTEG